MTIKNKYHLNFFLTLRVRFQILLLSNPNTLLAKKNQGPPINEIHYSSGSQHQVHSATYLGKCSLPSNFSETFPPLYQIDPNSAGSLGCQKRSNLIFKKKKITNGFLCKYPFKQEHISRYYLQNRMLLCIFNYLIYVKI